jgi:hypothetical protein
MTEGGERGVGFPVCVRVRDDDLVDVDLGGLADEGHHGTVVGVSLGVGRRLVRVDDREDWNTTCRRRRPVRDTPRSQPQ